MKTYPFAEGEFVIAKSNAPYLITNSQAIVKVLPYSTLDYEPESSNVDFAGKLIATVSSDDILDIGASFKLNSRYFRIAEQQEIIYIMDKCNLHQALRKKSFAFVRRK